MADEAGGRLILIRSVASDPDGDPLTFSAGIVSGQGSFSLDNASTGAYTFTPSPSYMGEVVVEFTASDGPLTSNEASEIFPERRKDVLSVVKSDFRFFRAMSFTSAVDCV